MHATASLFPQKIDNFDESSPHCYPAHIRVTETGAIFYMRASIKIRLVSMPYFIVRNTLDRHIRDHEYYRRCHFDAMNTYDLLDPAASPRSRASLARSCTSKRWFRQELPDDKEAYTVEII